MSYVLKLTCATGHIPLVHPLRMRENDGGGARAAGQFHAPSIGHEFSFRAKNREPEPASPSLPSMLSVLISIISLFSASIAALPRSTVHYRGAATQYCLQMRSFGWCSFLVPLSSVSFRTLTFPVPSYPWVIPCVTCEDG